MRRLFVDDERMPAQTDNDMYVVRSYDDAVAYISSFGCPDFISFDHDLGDEDESKTGYALAKWLVYKDLFARGRFIPEGFTFSVHSQNPIGAKNIEAYLTNYLTQRNTDLSGRL